MAERDGVITVRTFQSEEEIRELEGFVENNIVAKEAYARLLGDYRLPERLRCCLKRLGRRCSVGHNYGFVVQLTDDSVSIVGNKCANDTFGAQSTLAKDMKLYAKEKARQDALKRLAEILATRESSEAKVADMYQQLINLTERARTQLSEFGDYTANRIRAMSRTETNRVTVRGVQLRPYMEDGERKVERSVIDITVGVLPGLSSFRGDLARSVQDSLREVVAAYREADVLDDSATTATLQRINSTISGVVGVLDSGQRLLDAEITFKKADWSCLPFLAQQMGDRLRLARQALAQAGQSSSKDRAKEWLSELESKIKAQHNVQKLELA